MNAATPGSTDDRVNALKVACPVGAGSAPLAIDRVVQVQTSVRDFRSEASIVFEQSKGD
jgi:hypothetical protein